MTKVSRVGCCVYVAHAGVVDASVDWLAVDVCFVACYSGGDFAGVDGDGLCYRVLAKLIGIDNTKLKFLHPFQSQ